MSAIRFDFPSIELPPAAVATRQRVRDFLSEERAAGRLERPSKIGMGFSPAFSRRCGEEGYIGMIWPKRFGGSERSALERYVVTEEMLTAGAPVRAHWTADRQSGPVILRYGTEAQKEAFLPRIVRGECYFCIGLSEPDSGSDLASVKTRARKAGDGWVLNGTKLWTSNAHNSHYMIALCRTTPQGEQRYHGLTQFIIDLAWPGVTIRPIFNMAGDHDFNEVVFEDVRLPPDALLGTLDEGWRQVSAELAYERSGPERWLSAFRLFAELNSLCGASLPAAGRERLGGLFAELLTLREMSTSIAGMLEAGKTPTLEAAIVKDLGTLFEQKLVLTARDLANTAGLRTGENAAVFASLLESAMLTVPAYTIRGGTTEMLRGTIARGLGLR